MPPHTAPTEELRPVKQSFCVSLRQDTHCKSLILSVLIYICLGAIIWCRWSVISEEGVNIYDELSTQMSEATPCNNAYIYIPVAFFSMLWLLYLVECWNSHTRVQLQHKVDGNMIYERVRDMRDAQPIVWWKAVCYHYVRRTRQVTRYRNGDAFTTTQVYYERVNSHAAGSAFNYASCGVNDLTRVLVGLDRYPATKIRFTKGFSFATLEAEDQFEEQRSQFFEDNERRDDYMESQEGMDLLNVHFKEYMIAFADPDNLPWYVSHIIFWIASLLFLTWPLRVIIDYKTAYVHVHIHKVFGCECIDDQLANGPQGGELSRVSTMGSSEMEMTIRNNYSIVPSYSEALLIQSSSDAPYKFTYLLRRPMPVGGSKPKRSFTFSSLSSVLPAAGSRSSSFVRGSCSNGYLSGTTRDARLSNYIIANHGNSSLGSISQLNNNDGEEEYEDHSASHSDAQVVDEIAMRRLDRRRPYNRRQRKTAIHSCCPFTNPETSTDVTTPPSGVTQPPDDLLHMREPSSRLQPRLHGGRCDHEQLGNQSDHFCMVADASGVPYKNTTAAVASATAKIEANDYGNIYENAPLMKAMNGSYNRNVFHPPGRPISNSSTSPERYPHLFPSTNVLPQKMAHSEISGCNNNATCNKTNNTNRDNTDFLKEDTITGNNPNPNPNPNSNLNFNPNPIYTNLTYTFPNTTTVGISSDMVCCSSGGNCLNKATMPRLSQSQTDDESGESSIEVPHQGHMNPDNTGRITVIVMDETPRKDSSMEFVNNSSLTQRNQQLTLRPYLSLNKPNSNSASSSNSSSSSSRPGVNSDGGDIKGSYVGGRPKFLTTCNASRCPVADNSVVVGACACSDNTNFGRLNSSGNSTNPKCKVENSKRRHLWENNGRRQFLHKDRNFTYSIDIESDNTMSSSGSSMCEQPVSAIPKYHYDHIMESRQKRCNHHGNSDNKSTTQSSSLGRQAQVTNLQDEPDPPPSYEDAIWMQRLTSRNCPGEDNDDDDDRHHHHHRHRSNSLSQESTSRNQRPHKTIKLMETSI